MFKIDLKKITLRESSFNMTRGGGDEDIEGGLQKLVYFKTNRSGGQGAPKKLSC